MANTRSSLLWECQKVIDIKRPKYLLMENVKNLVGKTHKHNFDLWLEWLESKGYTNYWKVLNSKDYGVPQNRERVFVVSIFGKHKPYEFPEAKPLDKTLKDVLLQDVEDRHYLSQEQVAKLTFKLKPSTDIKQIGQLDRPNLRINYLPPQSSYTKRIVPAICILPLLRNLVKEKTGRLQSSSLSKQIQKQKLLLQHLYSIMKPKICQRKKSDNSHPTLKKGINKRTHSNAQLQYIMKSKSCQRKSLFKKMCSRTTVGSILQDHPLSRISVKSLDDETLL